MSTAIEGVSGTGLEAQSSQTDAVKSLIRWESPHPLSIAGVKLCEAHAVVQRRCSMGFPRLSPGSAHPTMRSCSTVSLALWRVRCEPVAGDVGAAADPDP